MVSDVLVQTTETSLPAEELLRRRRAELLALLRRVRHDDAAADGRDELPLADGDLSNMVNMAQAIVLQETDEAIRSVLERHIQEVEQALARLQQAGYGLCEDCGQPIPPERLQAVPEATRCVACQSQRDRLRRRLRR
jgi:DnaK suppressor protein